MKACAARANNSPIEDSRVGTFLPPRRKDAKFRRKNDDPQTSPLLILLPKSSRLCGLARDNPISSFAYFAFFTVNFFGPKCLVAVLLRWALRGETCVFFLVARLNGDLGG